MFRIGAEGSALKTLNLFTQFQNVSATGDPIPTGLTVGYYGQFRDVGDYWRGAVEDHFLGRLEDFDFACALLVSGIVIEDPLLVPPESSVCASLSTDPIAFTRPLEAADVEFFDFPTAPTF